MPSTRPRKRFGQHFLHDDGVIECLIAAIAPSPKQRLVEIGPGLGALTLPLLKAAEQLDVIELDRDLIPGLKKACQTIGQLRVHQNDALDFDFAALCNPPQRLRIVGNLPYNISTPLLFRLLTFAEHIDDMHVMLQKEVVTRLAAQPGESAYGRLSVMMHYHCKVEPLFDVSAAAFSPIPKVESAVVRLQPHQHPPVAVENPSYFATLVAQAFSQRRKTLRNSLKNMLSATMLEQAGIDPSARAETLSLADFAALSNCAHSVTS